MILNVRILGHNTSIEKPNVCPKCNKRVNPSILERVIDRNGDNLDYYLITKCPQCNEVHLYKYNIGNVNDLVDKEKESINYPIRYIVVK